MSLETPNLAVGAEETHEGDTYRLAEVYDADAGSYRWELVEDAPVVAPPIASVVSLSRLSREPVPLMQGDTPEPLRLAARDLAGSLVSIGGDWTCRAQVLDPDGAAVIAERAITETTTASGVTAFVARLTEAESLQLVPHRVNVPTTFRWLVEVADPSRQSIKTHEVRLAVSAVPN